MRLGSKRFVAVSAAVALAVSACGGGATPTPSPTTAPGPTATPAAPTATPTAAPVTINWWHITTSEPDKTQVWQVAADTYVAAHPNVTIKITVLENEDFKKKLATVMQSGQGIPDLFQSWGGGPLAEQAKDGKVQDITAAIASWKDEIEAGPLSAYAVNGKQYGVPWDMGMIGFFYNKDLWAKAGLDATPKTWTELLADIDKIKAANLKSPKTGKPVAAWALGGKDEWPGMHAWTYAVLRSAGAQALSDMITTKKWNVQGCIDGGKLIQQLAAKNPFQSSYLNDPYTQGEGKVMGNAEAVLELMGQWAPAVQIDQSVDKKGIANLGWFAFPAVDGGKGDPGDAVGGGNGIAVGKNAPPEAIDFLHYLNGVDVAKKISAGPKLDGKDTLGITTTKAAESIITDPILKQILAGRATAKYFQVYLDQFLSTAMGKVVNDQTATLFAKKGTPEAVCKALEDAAMAE